jgi:hypothetical protein
MRRTAFAAVVVAAIVVLPASAPAATKVLRATPAKVSFGTKPVGSFTLKGVTITNASSEVISLLVSSTRAPDDFSFGLLPGSTCPVLEPEALAPGDSCVAVVGFRPSEFFAGEKQFATLLATATDPSTGAVLDSVLINFVGRGRLRG